MMEAFVHDQQACRVVFGAGARERLRDEVERLGATCVLVLATPGQRRLAEAAAAQLGDLAVGVFAGAVMHVPVEVVTAARHEAERLQADATLAVGGGSTVGLAKALARDLGLPIVAMPTTYAGSEMTPIWGETAGGTKRTGRDPRVQPRTVVYDPRLTLDLPPRIAGPSGLNALAHCVEALYAPDSNPLVSLIAEEGIRALASALPRVAARPADIEARSDALYGAWLAGSALGQVTMSLHHKLCHVLGGSFDLPHAEVHCVVLPHATAYNRDAAPEAMARAARALGADDAAAGLFDLARALGAPTALKDFGMREHDLERAADLATRDPYANPRPVEREALRALLDDAYHGRRPAERAAHARDH